MRNSDISRAGQRLTCTLPGSCSCKTGVMLRSATASDVDDIVALMHATPGFWQPRWSAETVSAAIESARGLTFVWDEQAEIIGFVCGHDLGFRAYLSELVVASSARHRGIGTRLVRAVEEALRKRGQQTLIADVWHEAAAFYASLGWVPPDAVLLRRQIG